MYRRLQSLHRSIAYAIVACSASMLWSPGAEGAADSKLSAIAIRSARSEQPRTVRCGDRLAVETRNLRIYGLGNQRQAGAWAVKCEQLQAELCRRWLGAGSCKAWTPKCEIFLHPSRRAYLTVVGDEYAATLGASSIDRVGDKIVRRRIDVRADQPGWLGGALAHELTHLILADEFASSELPVWAEEGMAVLADPDRKQRLHERDLQVAQRSGAVRSLTAFLCDPGAPSPQHMPAFYGQSYSLVKYLVERKTPNDFVQFMHRAGQVGYDQALRDCYGLNGVAELERQWRPTFATPHSQFAVNRTATQRNHPAADEFLGSGVGREMR